MVRDPDYDRISRELSRRAFGRLTAATAGGLAFTGAASAHPSGSSSDHGDHEHDTSSKTTQVGYHSLGGVGSASVSGDPDEPHYGGLSEMRVHGDRGLAFVSIFSSKDPTNDRGLAILDVSDYTEATDEDELAAAEPTVLSFVRNDNAGSSVMDVKLSGDGNYAFICKQAIAVLFGEAGLDADTDGDSVSPEGAALQAFDVSDPGNPELVGSYDGWGLGPHNCFHHVIDGQDYVFAVKGADGTTAGLYVFEFDRTTGALVLVNYWTSDSELAQGEVGTEGNTFYAHDIVVQNDPKTGKPYGYFSNWNSGARVLDLSEPTDIEELGAFGMNRAHHTVPAPGLIDGKRVFVAGQENPSDENGYTGFYYLVDADPIDGYDGQPVDLGTASANPEAASEGGELDKWVWRTDTDFENFTLSSHNIDVAANGYVHVGHYHAGTRYLRIDPPNGNGKGEGDPQGWSLAENGFYRSHEHVPTDSKASGLTTAAPNFWCAVETNGLTFASDINTGVYVLSHDDIAVGTDVPVDIDASRSDDGSAFTAGQTNQVDIAVDADRSVLIRDRIPASWDVVAGDDTTVRTVGDRKVVTFDADVDSGTRTYFAEAPDETGTYTFGPVEYSADDGRTWETLGDLTEENTVVGTSTDA
jgi:hypothetical protein